MAQNYDFDDMSNLGFSGSPQKLISDYFSLIVLPIIVYYNKRTKLYHDQIKVCGIVAARIRLKMSIFSIFGTMSYYMLIFALIVDSKFKHFYVAHYKFPFVMKIFGTFHK